MIAMPQNTHKERMLKRLSASGYANRSAMVTPISEIVIMVSVRLLFVFVKIRLPIMPATPKMSNPIVATSWLSPAILMRKGSMYE